MPLPEFPLDRIADLCREYGVTELADLLGRDADDVDLVPKNYLHRVIRDRVLAEAQQAYAVAA